MRCPLSTRPGVVPAPIYPTSTPDQAVYIVNHSESKVALVHLVARMRLGGYTLLDTQFVTAHLTQFGAEEIPRDSYKSRLAEALAAPAEWLSDPGWDGLADEVRRIAGKIPMS